MLYKSPPCVPQLFILSVLLAQLFGFHCVFFFFFGVMFLTVPACPTTAAVSTLQGTNFLIAFQKFYPGWQ